MGIIDRNGSGTDHGLNREVVEKEMTEAGYRLEAKYDFTKADGQDYFLIFGVHQEHVERRKNKAVPQQLKLHCKESTYGTAEAVPSAKQGISTSSWER